MQALTPCPSCRRHVRSDALRCPFCDAEGVLENPLGFHAGSAPNRVRHAVLALGATLAVGACSAQPPPSSLVTLYGAPPMIEIGRAHV